MSTAEPRKSVKYELLPGDTLGKYEVLRKLAVGGMAELYLARIRGNAGFEKVVVLKRILPQVAEDPTFVQMFLEEARLAATLNHPNIAHVYDVGEVDGQHFFTMEFVYGQDVRSIRHEMRKREDAVPVAIGLAVVHGTAAALHYAHERVGPDGKLLGLVHRDVSASNVMVSYDGAIKLLDFGIARAATSTHKTQVGTLKGKVPYMSPEQCKGQPLDRRSDLFSLGVVMFELTVGRRPFRGDTDFAIMDQIVYKGAPRPSSIQPEYPAALEAIVMKLLERDPKARYTTGEELIEDLDAYIQTNSLWVSPTKIGKYMRAVFADKIKAWEEAEQQGVPFAQHVAHSITSQSQRSELVTPPSAFPGLPSKSAEMVAVATHAPTSQQMTAQPMPAQRISEPTIPGPKMPLVAPPSAPVRVPDLLLPPPAPPAVVAAPVIDLGSAPVVPLRPRSHRAIVTACAGALVLGAGILAFSMLHSSPTSPAPAASAGSAVEEVHAPATPIDLPPPAPEQTRPAVVEQPKPAVVAQPKAAVAKPAVARPAVVEQLKPAVVEKPKPVVVEKPKPVVSKPAVAKPPVTPAVKKPKPKEQTWDPNSPFLPQ